MTGPYAIQQFSINPTTWTPISAPFSCSSFSIRCDNDVVDERTDPNDASTQDTLALGVQEYVLGATIYWMPGQVIFYVKSHTLNTVLIAKFVGIDLRVIGQ